MLVSDQVRAARALLGWSARELAQKAGVHLSTVQRIERSEGPVQGNVRSIARVETTLTSAGIEFVNDDGRVGVMRRMN